MICISDFGAEALPSALGGKPYHPSADGGDANISADLKSEQYCSHPAFFGSGVLRTLSAALALTMRKSALPC